MHGDGKKKKEKWEDRFCQESLPLEKKRREE